MDNSVAKNNIAKDLDNTVCHIPDFTDALGAGETITMASPGKDMCMTPDWKEDLSSTAKPVSDSNTRTLPYHFDERPKWKRSTTSRTLKPPTIMDRRTSLGAYSRPPFSRITVNKENSARSIAMHQHNCSTVSRGYHSSIRNENELKEISKKMAKIFGPMRQRESEEGRTRHLGVVFKNITVNGQGLGAAIQPTVGDIFLGLPRALEGLFKRGASNANPPIKIILNKFTGCIRPGEMLLVLGRPGSGVSTFLKVIGNQRYGYKGVDGRVTYGGERAEAMAANYRSEILYNPEVDLQYATLRVRDTLRFALKTRTPGSQSRNEGESRKEYIEEFLQVVTKLLWIEHTMDTMIGNEYKRGVSGGEKKRVSIAEALITKASVQCWDNPTRGLDSSAALEYVRVLRSLANMARISTAVALYQASEDMWNCFDKVLLIDGGECCFFGPIETAVQYFEGLGFVKPERWTSADFLTSVSSEYQRQIRPGFEDWIPRTPREFAEAFRDSDEPLKNLEDIAQFESTLYNMMEMRRDMQTTATETKNYTLPFWKQVLVLTHRQFLVMKGDPQTLVGKWGGVLFEAIIIGSLFFDMPQTSDGIFLRGGVLFFMLLFNALLALAELTPAFVARPILMKHESFSFYRPAAYAIAQIVLDIPLLFIQVTMFDLIVYSMSGLQRTASHFLIANLFLYLLTMTVYAAFRAIGATVPSLDAATRFSGLGMQVLVVYTDYIIPPKEMKPWLSWMRWLNPIQYCFEALMVNEFDGLDIECVPANIVPQGPSAQPQFQSCTVQGSKPGSTSVSGKDYLEVSFGFRRSHLWRNFGIIFVFFLFFVAVTALGMEAQKSTKGGGAVTIFKRDQAPRLKKKTVYDDFEEEIFYEEKYRTEYAQSVHSLGGAADSRAVITWQNVNYTIPYKGGMRQLLHNVQGYVKPGKLTALMGSSGAGKTTILNTLAQRIHFGAVTGDFRVDGQPLPSSFQRAAGFAEQMDIHEPSQTVREALRFSAKLRQPQKVPLREKYLYCEEILDLLEMREIAGAVIGEPGAGLNQEQRKRLTIAIELASKPELLIFLDEPTSGLDSIAAANIVRLLRKLADSGQSILCTIHQPSAVLFEYFDMLLFLKRGGHMVYFGELGPGSCILLDYLERNGATKCPPEANPAEYILEAIGAGKPDQMGKDWADIWSRSKENALLTQEIQDIVHIKSASGPRMEDSREYAMPIHVQISTVVQRSFSSIWRSRDYVTGIFVLHILVGIFSTMSFWMLGHSQAGMQSRLFAVFMTLIIAPPLMQQLQPRFLEARNIYASREAKAKIYTWYAFVTGAIVSEIPYRVLAGTLYWACWYFGIGFPQGNLVPFKVWSLIVMFELFYLGLALGIAAFSPSTALASFFIPLFFMFVIAFCGVAVPFIALPKFWKWMYYVTPFTYLLEAMLGLVVHNVPVTCARDELAIFQLPPGLTCEKYVGSYVLQIGGYVQTLDNGFCGYCQFKDGDQFAASLNIFERHFWRDFWLFWAYIVFNFAFVYACSWFNLQGGRQIKTFFGGLGTQRRQGKEIQDNEKV